MLILHTMNRNEPTDIHKYDGIKLVSISAMLLALLLAFGCKRGNPFAKATAEDPGNYIVIDGESVIDDVESPATAQIPEAEPEPTSEPAPDTAKAESPQPVAVPAAASPIETGKDAPNHGRIRVRNIGSLMEVFNDSNKYQYAAAERLGIRPIRSLGQAYFTTRPIVEVRSNRYYTVDELKHSFPYLVPEAEKVLSDIGRNFIDSLERRGGGKYRLIVTSLLRTPHTVKRLRRVNRNAVDSSTHQFGTTFDISFTRFHNLDRSKVTADEDLKNLLGEVLLDMRDNKRCLVKYERKGGCFHITATK